MTWLSFVKVWGGRFTPFSCRLFSRSNMISFLIAKKVHWSIAIPVGLVVDIVLAIIITDFIRSLM